MLLSRANPQSGKAYMQIYTQKWYYDLPNMRHPRGSGHFEIVIIFSLLVVDIYTNIQI